MKLAYDLLGAGPATLLDWNENMSQSSADRNLLFGILAVQMDLVTRDGLIAGMGVWVLNKTRSLSEILVEHKYLKAEHRDLLEPLVAVHLQQHGNDPEQSLAALKLNFIDSTRLGATR